MRDPGVGKFRDLTSDGTLRTFGFWLPNGIGPGRDVGYICEQLEAPFKRVEECALNYFKMGHKIGVPNSAL